MYFWNETQSFISLQLEALNDLMYYYYYYYYYCYVFFKWDSKFSLKTF